MDETSVVLDMTNTKCENYVYTGVALQSQKVPSRPKNDKPPLILDN